MTINSTGYDGSVSEASWAVLSALLGADYAVGGYTDLQVTIGGSGDRAVTVALGIAFGSGVMDKLTGSTTVLNADSVSSGTRWDTVVVHRDWSGSGGTTTLRINKGGPKLIVQTDTTPGSADDQPLAMIRCIAGSTAVQEVLDLRTVPLKMHAIASHDSILYAEQVFGGLFLAMDTGEVHGPTGPSGSAAITNLEDPNYTTWTTSNGLAGSAGVLIPNGTDPALQFGAAHGWGCLRGSLKRNTGNLISAGSTDLVVGTLPVVYRPQAVRRFQCPAGQPAGSGSWNQTVGVSVFSDGTVKVAAAEKDVPWMAFDGCSWWLGD